MSGDPYDSDIIAKLDRALRLRDDLQVMQADLRGQWTEPEYESHSNAHEPTSPLVWIEWRLKREPEPLPLGFSALLGDVIHNLRSALDYCAWAAVADEVRASKPSDVMFPLLADVEKFATWRAKKVTWYSGPTLRAIEWAQPYKAAPRELHPLRVLQQLSNTDKHRLLNVVKFAHVDLGPVGIEPEPVVKLSTATSGNVKVGDMLARVEFPRPEERGEFTLRPQFGWYESVFYTQDGQSRPLRIDEMMNSMCSFVVEAVTRLHIARRIERGEIAEEAVFS